jgi:hypothetical protein
LATSRLYLKCWLWLGSTINKWIDDRIYYDADDALIKPELPNLTNAFKKKTSGGSSREEGSDGPKSPKLDSG